MRKHIETISSMPDLPMRADDFMDPKSMIRRLPEPWSTLYAICYFTCYFAFGGWIQHAKNPNVDW